MGPPAVSPSWLLLLLCSFSLSLSSLIFPPTPFWFRLLLRFWLSSFSFPLPLSPPPLSLLFVYLLLLLCSSSSFSFPLPLSPLLLLCYSSSFSVYGRLPPPSLFLYLTSSFSALLPPLSPPSLSSSSSLSSSCCAPRNLAGKPFCSSLNRVRWAVKGFFSFAYYYQEFRYDKRVRILLCCVLNFSVWLVDYHWLLTCKMAPCLYVFFNVF